MRAVAMTALLATVVTAPDPSDPPPGDCKCADSATLETGRCATKLPACMFSAAHPLAAHPCCQQRLRWQRHRRGAQRARHGPGLLRGLRRHPRLRLVPVGHWRRQGPVLDEELQGWAQRIGATDRLDGLRGLQGQQGLLPQRGRHELSDAARARRWVVSRRRRGVQREVSFNML